MRFANQSLLFLIFLIPALAFIYFFAFKRKVAALRTFGEQKLLELLSSSHAKKQHLKFALTLAALFFFIVAIARPQIGTKLVQIEQKGADIVLLVDVSTSMLAEDAVQGAAQGITRLDKAKQLLSLLIQRLSGNRIGIIAFAGSAFWQCPLTLDTSSVNLFLEIMDASLIPLPGTAIGKALSLANKGLEKTPPKSKAIILITDGEDHQSSPVEAAQESAKQGIQIFTIGFGNPQGEPIPMKDDQGNFHGYKKDKKGDVVMSKLDESLLAKIAAMTDGHYFKAADGSISIDSLAGRIRGLKQQDLSTAVNREYEDRFQYPLCLGIILLCIEMLLPGTKKRP